MCILAIPYQVAKAYSLRFGDHAVGIAAIEKVMLHLEQAWKKFMPGYKKEE